MIGIRLLWHSVVTAGLLLLSACNSGRETPVADDQLITKSERLAIYPNAVTVKLFVGHIINNEKSEFINTKGHLLTSSERSQFESFISRTILVHQPETDEEATGTACFDPHHFFRYYDSESRQIGEISICFCCEGAEERPAIYQSNEDSWVSYDYKSIKSLVTKIGLPTDYQCDVGDKP